MQPVHNATTASPSCLVLCRCPAGLLSVETYTACDSPPPDQQLAALLQAVDIFSPNEAEAASIVGPGSPQQLVQRLLAAGARTVSLRMGPEGVLVADGPSRTMWHVSVWRFELDCIIRCFTSAWLGLAQSASGWGRKGCLWQMRPAEPCGTSVLCCLRHAEAATYPRKQLQLWWNTRGLVGWLIAQLAVGTVACYLAAANRAVAAANIALQ